MMRLKKYILMIFAFGLSKSYAQQTLQLSQYIFNGLAVNPAYAGYKEDWTLNLSSRLQWAGVDGAPKTSTLSIDGVTNPDNKTIGLGLLVSNDRLGPENNSSVYANYAFRIRLNDDDSQRLCLGVAVGAIVFNIDGSLFNTGNTTDPSISSGVQNKLAPDFRVGIYYYTPLFYIGASGLNMVPDAYPDPVSIFIKQVRTYYLSTGFIVPLSDAVNWKPSFLVKEDFKGPTNVSAATYFLFGDLIWVGASYTTGLQLWKKSSLQSDLNRTDGVTGIAAVNITSQCRFGYSYDVGTSRLAGYQSASHEISFTYSFGRAKGRILSPRYF